MTPGPGAALVVVPARDEEGMVGLCLRSVRRSLTTARAEHPGLRTFVVLVAHHCTDGTAQIARRLLRGSGAVLVDASPTVGRARANGVRRGRALLHASHPVEAGRTWILSTDADTTVPPTWVRDLLRHGDQGARAVTGLVELGPGLPPPTQAAHSRHVAGGLRVDGHDHVYAANLGVRADAYDQVGGWPTVAVGEDQALVDALRRAGHPVTTALDLTVRTSSRRTPRAVGGLGTLLADLA